MLTSLTEMTDAYVQAEFQLGNVEDGLLPSAFLAGLLIASVVYSELTTRYNAFRLTGKQGPLRRLGFCHAIIAMHECLQSTLASACKGLHSQAILQTTSTRPLSKNIALHRVSQPLHCISQPVYS